MSVNYKNIVFDGEVFESFEFFVVGFSLIVYFKNFMVLMVYFNYRYFEMVKLDGLLGVWWFGGGSDLIFSYFFDEDVIQFYRDFKEVCDKYNKDYYLKFKKWCDEYFYNKYCGEVRGIGGIFFDDLDEIVFDKENMFVFIQDLFKLFILIYVFIVLKCKDMFFIEVEKDWQQIRRGKYVEFNFVYDWGMLFGLNMFGVRVESIFMSMLLMVSWRYMYEFELGSREVRLVEILQNLKEWVQLMRV